MKHRYHDVVFLPYAQDVVKYIDKKNYGEDNIIITMGAGDVYKIVESMVGKQKIRNPKHEIRNKF
jgi:UDP-N-acetylmuramate-alanine ligase